MVSALGLHITCELKIRTFISKPHAPQPEDGKKRMNSARFRQHSDAEVQARRKSRQRDGWPYCRQDSEFLGCNDDCFVISMGTVKSKTNLSSKPW